MSDSSIRRIPVISSCLLVLLVVAGGRPNEGEGEGNSLEELYVTTLPECLHAGRCAYHELEVKMTHRESHLAWAAIDGRQTDETPVRIKGQVVPETRTRVVFTVGTRSSEKHQAFVRQLKQVFEAQLRLANSNVHERPDADADSLGRAPERWPR